MEGGRGAATKIVIIIRYKEEGGGFKRRRWRGSNKHAMYARAISRRNVCPQKLTI